MADHPLRSATDRRLGEPLPHQLPNRTRVHLSPIKSLTAEPCDSAVLCGISVRFQTLSPCERQVTHALLTRPPLSREFQSRRIFQNDSVRLACVRHAASVHPEPGSNSLKIVFKEPKFLKSTLESDVSLCFNWSCDFQRFTKSKKLSKFQVRTTTLFISNKILSTSLFNLQGTICCFQAFFRTFRSS